MISKKIITITVILAVVLVGAGLLLNFTFNSFHPVGKPAGGFSHSFTPINTKDMNVSQGSTLLMNLSFTSMQTQPMLLPLENLQLIAYYETMDSKDWGRANWNASTPQERILNYSFSLNPLTLQPLTSNSTTLTINIANNAPAGRYQLDLNIGNVKDEVSGITYSSTIGIVLIVTPKTG